MSTATAKTTAAANSELDPNAAANQGGAAGATSSEPKSAAARASKPARISKPLPEGRLKLVVASSADVGNVFAAVTPSGTSFEEVLEPEYWVLCAQKLRVGDEIKVHTDDGTYYGLLYVRDVSSPAMGKVNNRAVVAELAFHQLGPVKRDLRTKTHEAKFMGPHLKWCVIALSDGSVLKDGFSTAEEAQGWMRSRPT